MSPSSSSLSPPFSPTPSSSTISSSITKLNLEPNNIYIDPLITLAPTPANLTKIAARLGSNDQTQSHINQIFTTAYLRAASTGDSDLLEWLLSHNGFSPRSTHPASPSSGNITSSKNITTPNNRSSTPNPPSSIRAQKITRSSSFSNPIPPFSLRSTPHPTHKNNSSSSLSSPQAILLPGQARQWINLDARDEDGSPAIILAAAFGHAEAVRAIVDGLGDQVVNSRDAVGWTALHWAARNGDLTIVSYLLNHGALTSLVSFTDRPSSDCSPSKHTANVDRPQSLSSIATLESDSYPSSSIMTDDNISNSTPTAQSCSKRRKARKRGLRPYDLTKHDEQGEVIRQILLIAEQTKITPPSNSRPQSQASLRIARLTEAQSEADLAKSESMKIIELARLCSKTLEIDPTLLGLSESSQYHTTKESDFPLGFGNNHHHQQVITGLLASLNSEWEAEQQSEEFHWDRCEPDQMLVCSIDETPRIFEAVIKTIEPRQARSERFVPANILFLCARFAAHMGTTELLEEILLGAVDLIEEMIFARQDNLANSTFWLFNATCLLYYVRRDPLMKDLTKEIQVHLEDLINEIYVFIIRDAERRMDKLIDSAILDFESLPEMAVDFEPEGSWRFVRALTVKRSRALSSRLPIAGFNLSAPKDNHSSNSPTKPASSSSMVSVMGGHGPRMTSLPNRSTPLSSGQQQTKTPILVIDLLSSVLYLLQAYEIHGSIIVQTFSQIFYWLSCEVFNRIISRRKYLCRSKAKQIELNLAMIEEWSQLNRLPAKLIGKHFEPLKQLLRWIQILSSINGNQSFDQLIESISTLKKLNPAQLLKVSRDYRFEIDESKLEEECRQYLVQTQQEWDRRRIHKVNQLEEEEKQSLQSIGAVGAGGGDEAKSPNPATSPDLHSQSQEEISKDEGMKKAISAIDLAFGSDNYESYRSYDPPMAPECLGELLDSRQMLPFGLPTSNDVLMKLKRTVPFGSLRSYLIPDLPKSAKDWWSFSTSENGEEEDNDSDDEKEEEEKEGDIDQTENEEEEKVEKKEKAEEEQGKESSNAENHEIDRNITPTSMAIQNSEPSNHLSPPSAKSLTPSNSSNKKLVQKLTPHPVVPIVSTQVLQRIDFLVFKSFPSAK